jgi:Replication protein C C-terminal region
MTPALGNHQARKLLAAPQADTLKSKRDLAVLSTLLFHALRREELCKLKVRDVQHARKGVPHLKVSSKGGKTRYLHETQLAKSARIDGTVLRYRPTSWSGWRRGCGVIWRRRRRAGQDWRRGELGVSKPLWGEACLAMGREEAAIAVAIVSAKPADHFRSSPGGISTGWWRRQRLESSTWRGRSGVCVRVTGTPVHCVDPA